MRRARKRGAVAASVLWASLGWAGGDEAFGTAADYGEMVDSACPVCTDGAELLERVEASSELAGTKTARYDARQAMDGKPATAWCEGKKGPGVGESLTFTFREPVYVAMVQLWGGYFKAPKVLADNGRLAKVKLDFDGRDPVVLQLADPAAPTKGAAPKARFEQASQWPVTWQSSDDWFTQRKKVRKLKLTVLEVHAGRRFEDTCVSDLKFTVATQAALESAD